MGLYELGPDSLVPLGQTTLASENVRERRDLQRLLRDQIDILDPDLLVISEEFALWEDSRRRIDLLAVDREANLVVIELKRDESGGHMDLQALRYAAMVSAMTWTKAVEAFGTYLGPVNTKGRFVVYWGYENHRVPISSDRGLLSASARQCEHLQSRSA